MRHAAAVALVLLTAACGQEKPEPQSAPAPSSVLPATASAAAPGVAAATGTFEDPEPPGAHARAVAVVDTDFNRNKRTSLAMNITTIVGRTSELEGFSTGVAAREDKIDERLARLNAKVTDTEVVIQLPGAILFDFDSANIRADADRALNDVAQVIKAYPQRPVRVEGHTDSISSDEYNQSLSERRAASVVKWLAAHGIEKTRLASSGFGETRPVATNDTAAGRQLNRRVEVVIAKK